jgi:hypothetical protein
MVIVGITESGGTFRPSDRAERLCGCMSVFGENQRIAYSPDLKPAARTHARSRPGNEKPAGVAAGHFCRMHVRSGRFRPSI